MDTTPTLVFIDAYDSFSNNVIALLEHELQVRVVKIRIDTKIPHLADYLKNFSGVVIGPGPGTPENPEDVGIINDIWQLSDHDLLPVLGICLGFQSLVYQFGGTIGRLPRPRHGQETTVVGQGSSIFAGCDNFKAVQYHSLYASIDQNDVDCSCKSDGQTTAQPLATSDLIPLAWDFEVPEVLGEDNGESPSLCACKNNPQRILMAVRHRTKPFYGVQFHPESVCSSPDAKQIVRNWWREVQAWSHTNRPNKSHIPFLSNPTGQHTQLYPTQLRSSSFNPNGSIVDVHADCGSHPASRLQYHQLDLDGLDLPSICARVGICQNENEDAVILDSAKQMNPLGSSSIIGVQDSQTIKISYHVGTHEIHLRRGGEELVKPLNPDRGIFGFLHDFLDENQLHDSAAPENSPFWGGLIGYIDYEACLETISVSGNYATPSRPNLSFVFIERSIVIDHNRNCLYIQSIRPDDHEWLDRTADILRDERIRSDGSQSPRSLMEQFDVSSSVELCCPDQSEYQTKIRDCQEELKAGNSYELCLTDQTKIRVASGSQTSSWQKYLKLRSVNPAPFAAYFRLGPLTLTGSSPERFLSWTRPKSVRNSPGGPPVRESVCQFRPIKGTVKKNVTGPNGQPKQVSYQEAFEVLSTPKERGENLMIADLIRHDLAGVLGGGQVRTPALMSVEEYETVFQLVTVIEGSLYQPALPLAPRGAADPPTPPEIDGNDTAKTDEVRLPNKATGIDVLAASLPPGSMTGAPKKRSCELLTRIEEGQPRSVYSGVLGYMDVGGRGDFAVVIRTLFKWDDEQTKEGDEEMWRVGAGGAVTVLSTEEGEWEEMNVKLSSVLGLFKE